MMKIVSLNGWKFCHDTIIYRHLWQFFLQWNVYILLWQIPESKVLSIQTSEEFKVLLSEKGTKFEEKIRVEGINGLDYFYVPAHNVRVEADYLYDFKQVI